MKRVLFASLVLAWVAVIVASAHGKDAPPDHAMAGKHLFEKETFGGNGRTCSTCHSAATGTVSPEDAQRRFARNPNDPLFRHDGSDDFEGPTIPPRDRWCSGAAFPPRSTHRRSTRY
jgi:hypothetical protein